MAYTVTIRDILFNTDTVACACLLLKAGTLGLRSQPKQQVVLVCQLKFDQLTNTVNRLVKRIYTMQEMDIKTWRHFKHENLLFQTLMCLKRSCRKVLLTREWMSIMHHWDLICQHGPEYTLITKVNIYRSHVVTGSRNQNWVFAATVTKDVFVDKEEQLFIYQTPTTNLQGRAGGKQIINPFYSPL